MSNKTCSECGKVLSSTRNLRQHLWRLHEIGEAAEVFQCEHCAKVFPEKRNLNQHLWCIHELGDGEIFTCDACEIDFKLEQHLKRHNQTVHVDKTKKKIMKCDQCGKIFNRQDTLKAHIIQVHGNQKKFSCETCGETFKRNTGLTRHIESVHQDTSDICCSECDKTFARKDILSTHLWVVHDIGDKELFSCEECDMDFKFNYYLKEHMIDEHDKGDFECAYGHSTSKLVKYNDKNAGEIEICRKCYKKVTGFKSKKEEQMVDKLKSCEEIAPFIILANKVIKHKRCKTRRRPDLLISSANMHMVVECDQRQHDDYPPICESGRMDEIIDEFTDGKIVFIRWNPDKYDSPTGKRKNRNGTPGTIAKFNSKDYAW